jgi:hypothetical protein
MKKTTISVLATAMSMTAATALAQTPTAAGAPSGRDNKVFVAVNVGGQAQAHEFDATVTTPVYNQTATATTTVGVDGGPIFDLNAEYRFLQNMGVGIGFSTFGKTGDLSGVASVPHPTFFNRHETVTIPAQGAKRSERSVYVTFVYSYKYSDEIDLSAYIGPSFLHAEQDVASGLVVPAGTQDATVTVERQSGNGVGLIAGFDVSYWLTDRFGAGGFMRYNGGSVDLPAVDGLDAGGFQLGIGLRVRLQNPF